MHAWGIRALLARCTRVRYTVDFDVVRPRRKLSIPSPPGDPVVLPDPVEGVGSGGIPQSSNQPTRIEGGFFYCRGVYNDDYFHASSCQQGAD